MLNYAQFCSEIGNIHEYSLETGSENLAFVHMIAVWKKCPEVYCSVLIPQKQLVFWRVGDLEI